MLSSLLLLGTALAAQVTIQNVSGEQVRITSLHDKCKGELLSTYQPIILKPGQEVTLNLSDVVHTYTVCGGGLCSNSAFGIKVGKNYQGSIVIENGVIGLNMDPDDFRGGNFLCPLSKK